MNSDDESSPPVPSRIKKSSFSQDEDSQEPVINHRSHFINQPPPKDLTAEQDEQKDEVSGAFRPVARPKPPRAAFSYFRKECLPELSALYPLHTLEELTEATKRLWDTCDQSPYFLLAKKDRKRYDSEKRYYKENTAFQFKGDEYDFVDEEVLEDEVEDVPAKRRGKTEKKEKKGGKEGKEKNERKGKENQGNKDTKEKKTMKTKRPYDFEDTDGKKTRKKQKVDDEAPKKPRRAYNLFCDRYKDRVKGKYPEASPNLIREYLGNLWKTLDNERKEKFNVDAKVDKVRYEREMREYQRRKVP
eukprot:TRINITY_DN9751_c0_g1_i1.p1 TRINITY_DN9751_c0_g1~~TRINITY_DN9751_c0_g1_i1.p1  ORF type:complete len:311 (-),score=82.64 TRINITY_DN9751_c0_g1_i1:119-1024(-)